MNAIEMTYFGGLGILMSGFAAQQLTAYGDLGQGLIYVGGALALAALLTQIEESGDERGI